MSWHQTIIVGNLGRDPEYREVNGRAVCNMSIAVNETWTDRSTNERREKTTWYKVAVWGNQASACNTYLRKGSQVMVTGTVEARPYVNNGGEAAASLELRARDVKFLGGGDNAGQGDGYDAPPADIGDIPF